MQQQITSKSYRRDKIIEFTKRLEMINKHYEVLWEIAKEFQESSPNVPFRVETIYGDFQFNPQIKLKYE
mgnify:CR=1 FL=1